MITSQSSGLELSSSFLYPAAMKRWRQEGSLRPSGAFDDWNALLRPPVKTHKGSTQSSGIAVKEEPMEPSHTNMLLGAFLYDKGLGPKNYQHLPLVRAIMDGELVGNNFWRTARDRR